MILSKQLDEFQEDNTIQNQNYQNDKVELKETSIQKDFKLQIKTLSQDTLLQEKNTDCELKQSESSLQLNSRSSQQNQIRVFDVNNIMNIITKSEDEYRYFNRDDSDDEQQEQMKRFYPNYYITFRLDIFLEFYFYHFLYNCLFGPIISLVLYKKPGIILMKNLQFYGKNFLSQFILYSQSFAIIFLYFYYEFKSVYFYGEIINLFFEMNLRNTVIAIKYSTYSYCYIDYIKNNDLNDEDIKCKIYLQEWSRQTDKIIYQEANFVLKLFGQDENFFAIQFFKKTSLNQKILLDQYSKTFQDMESDLKNKKVLLYIYDQNDDNHPIYSGYAILKYFIQQHDKLYSTEKKMLYTSAIIYSTIRSLIPTFMRYQEGKNMIGDTWVESLDIFLMYSVFLYFFSTTLLLLEQGVFDLHRANYFMIQLGMMISPKKQEDTNIKKLFPTLNIICTINIKGWYMLRQVCLHYGKQFIVRVFILSAILITTMTLVGFFLILSLQDMISNMDNAFFLNLTLDMMVVNGIALTFLFQAALLNQQFDSHIKLLKENTALIRDIYRYKDIYFSNYKPKNYLAREIIIILKQHFNLNQDDTLNEIQLQEISEYIKNIKKTYKETVDELVNEEQQYPFQIFGIKITMTLVQAFASAMFSFQAGIITSKMILMQAEKNILV